MEQAEKTAKWMIPPLSCDVIAGGIPLFLFGCFMLGRPYYFAGRLNSPWLLLLADCGIILWMLAVLVSGLWLVRSFAVAVWMKTILRAALCILLCAAILTTFELHRRLVPSLPYSMLGGLQVWAIPKTDADAIRKWTQQYAGMEYDTFVPSEDWPECIRVLSPENVRITTKYETGDVLYAMTSYRAAIIPYEYGIAVIPIDENEYRPNGGCNKMEAAPGGLRMAASGEVKDSV